MPEAGSGRGREGAERGWLSALGARPSPVTVTVVRYGVGHRIGRAVLGAGACWAAAAAAVFIPVAHFILVPGLLVAGAIVGFLRLRADRRLLGARGVCPRCGAEQEFEVSGRTGTEGAVDCPGCHNRLRVSLGSDPATDRV
jgi:hypothetical protein